MLGGGGSRGFAHIGVIRALEEAGIPIDAICGVSMGAILAAQYAMGHDTNAMLRMNKTGIIDNHLNRDFTIPLVSITSMMARSSTSRVGVVLTFCGMSSTTIVNTGGSTSVAPPTRTETSIEPAGSCSMSRMRSV